MVDLGRVSEFDGLDAALQATQVADRDSVANGTQRSPADSPPGR